MPISDPTPPADASATLANWRRAPLNRWAFRNARAIMPVAEIARGGPISPLPPGEPALQDFRLELGDTALDLPAFMQATAGDALVVLRDGRVVHEAYGANNDVDTRHILMSASKSVTGLIAGALGGRGELDVEAPVAAYVPEIAGTAFAGATVRHLLDMRTGVVLSEREQALYAAAAGWDPPPPGDPPGDLRAFFATPTTAHDLHGGSFRYISANTDLLGWVMERASGQSFATLASTLLWKPLGVEADAYVTTDASGAARCTGGLCATARDFARIGQMVVAGGRVGDAQIVPAAWIDDLGSGGDPRAWADGEWGAAFAFAGREMSYRSGWYAVHDEPATLFAMGIHGQNLFVDRENRIVMAKVSSQDAPIDYRAVPLTHMVWDAVRRALLEG